MELKFIYSIISPKQVSLNGTTGFLQFNEQGERKRVELEILNLRNNSFKKVGISGFKLDPISFSLF